MEKLLSWYKKHGRKLPWRRTRDPYKILVSEVMLQQTQVPRVLLYYEKWLTQFPSWRSLAQATNAQVIRAWSGLGYNRRALMLRDVAKTVVGQGVPKSETDWQKLKGIGPYTAAALAVFSLRTRALPIDVNVRRVLGRVFFGKPYPTPKIDRLICENKRIVFGRAHQFYDVPQALFDLSTMICKKKPLCEICPLRTECKTAPRFLSGGVKTPKRSLKKSRERIRIGKKYPDRIYRGRILKLAAHIRGVGLRHVGSVVDPAYTPRDAAWMTAMIERLIADKLVVRRRGRLFVE
ncbi:A/G-specific adenine glycosylase [Candidatus Uhrbacteria bacterium]|nr:A/G-specific adenine glycosylase [Candidatus Uhrbacteria bacterium]